MERMPRGSDKYSVPSFDFAIGTRVLERRGSLGQDHERSRGECAYRAVAIEEERDGPLPGEAPVGTDDVPARAVEAGEGIGCRHPELAVAVGEELVRGAGGKSFLHAELGEASIAQHRGAPEDPSDDQCVAGKREKGANRPRREGLPACGRVSLELRAVESHQPAAGAEPHEAVFRLGHRLDIRGSAFARRPRHVVQLREAAVAIDGPAQRGGQRAGARHATRGQPFAPTNQSA